MNHQTINDIVNSILQRMDCDELRRDKEERIKQELEPVIVLKMLENLSDDISNASSRKGRLPNNHLYYWRRSIKEIQQRIKTTLIVVPLK